MKKKKIPVMSRQTNESIGADASMSYERVISAKYGAKANVILFTEQVRT